MHKKNALGPDGIPAENLKLITGTYSGFLLCLMLTKRDQLKHIFFVLGSDYTCRQHATDCPLNKTITIMYFVWKKNHY